MSWVSFFVCVVAVKLIHDGARFWLAYSAELVSRSGGTIYVQIDGKSCWCFVDD